MAENKYGILSTECFKCAHCSVCKYKDKYVALKGSVREFIDHGYISKDGPFELKAVCKNFMEAKPLPVNINIDIDDYHFIRNRKPISFVKETDINDIIHNRDILGYNDDLN